MTHMKTFVVRVWAPADDAPSEQHDKALRGKVEDVASGRSVPFRNETELTGLIHSFMDGARGEPT